jgi:hypothetical protein
MRKLYKITYVSDSVFLNLRSPQFYKADTEIEALSRFINDLKEFGSDGKIEHLQAQFICKLDKIK